MQLVIAEKPSVAQSIAKVLEANQWKNGYLEGSRYIVSWCVGHLVELAQPNAYGEEYSKWNYESLPIIPEQWEHVIKEDTEEQYNILKALMHDARVDSVVCATDAGREGELIFRLVYEMAGCTKPIKRLWISSMEESAIKEGFENLRPGSEYEHLYQAALSRQQADWLVGINGTRLFTVLYAGKVLKVGRVQTPTLAMLVEREMQITNFVKEKYFTSHILIGEKGIDAGTERINDENMAKKIASECEGKTAEVTKVVRERKKVAPPKLYDLTTLQRDANRLLGYTAKETLEYTQNLYEKKLCTYPRTDSRYLSDDMAATAENVIKVIFEAIPAICPEIIFRPNIKSVLNSKKVTDHHAIIPTMEIMNTEIEILPEGERKILFLLSSRLLSATAMVHTYEAVKAEITCNNHVFNTSGKSIIDTGWRDFEIALKKALGKRAEEKESEEPKLPELTEGMVFENVKTGVNEHFTTPPKHYTEDSLLSAMERAGNEDMDDDVERKGLGTPATRADIIEKLVKDGFVKREKKKLIPTEDGLKLITILPDVIKSPKLTADWENMLTLVSKGECEMNEFMSGIKTMVKELVTTYHSVSEEDKKIFVKPQEVLGKCPKCAGEVVKGKYGIFCKNKCGMNVGKAMGQELTEEQVKKLLAGKKILVKGLKSKSGKKYDAYLVPEGIEDYSYINKEGNLASGSQYKLKMEFPKKRIRRS